MRIVTFGVNKLAREEWMYEYMLILSKKEIFVGYVYLYPK